MITSFSLVSELLEPLQADPQNLIDTVHRVAMEVRSGDRVLA